MGRWVQVGFFGWLGDGEISLGLKGMKRSCEIRSYELLGSGETETVTEEGCFYTSANAKKKYH